MHVPDIGTIPITVTVTLSTPARGMIGRLLRPRLRTTTTVDVPIPVDITPEGVTEDGTHAVMRVEVDTERFGADLQDRLERAVAEFGRATDA